MDAIVAVYADWGIGAKGTQPLVIPADRRRFRALTMGAAVIVGRRTLDDFPGGRPLPGRENLVLTRQNITIDGAQVVHSPAEAVAAAAQYDHCFVIGGDSVFRQMFPPPDARIRHENRLSAPLRRVFPGSGRRPRVALRIERATRRAQRRWLSVLRVRKSKE